jgi:hypothetical protein
MTDTPMFTTPGEIGHAERLAYHALTREHYTGRGEIVEIGALLGASSVCLAQGLAGNAAMIDADIDGRIHVYDKFEVYPHLADLVFPFHGIAPRKVGSSFRDLYEANTKSFASMITIHEGDAHKATWCGKPIEILFIDCAVSAHLYQHLMDVFYPHLIEGALIVDQDFFYQFAPWLPVKAELMATQIKPLAAVDCALIARATTPAPCTPIALAHMPVLEALRLMERQAIRWPGEIAALVHIQAAVAMFTAGLGDQAKKRMAEIGEWPLSPVARSRYASAAERIST